MCILRCVGFVDVDAVIDIDSVYVGIATDFNVGFRSDVICVAILNTFWFT